MNVQRFTNLGDYLRDLTRSLNRQAALKGADAFTVQVHDGGLSEDDLHFLK